MQPSFDAINGTTCMYRQMLNHSPHFVSKKLDHLVPQPPYQWSFSHVPFSRSSLYVNRYFQQSVISGHMMILRQTLASRFIANLFFFCLYDTGEFSLLLGRPLSSGTHEHKRLNSKLIHAGKLHVSNPSKYLYVCEVWQRMSYVRWENSSSKQATGKRPLCAVFLCSFLSSSSGWLFDREFFIAFFFLSLFFIFNILDKLRHHCLISLPLKWQNDTNPAVLCMNT